MKDSTPITTGQVGMTNLIGDIQPFDWPKFPIIRVKGKTFPIQNIQIRPGTIFEVDDKIEMVSDISESNQQDICNLMIG